MLNNSEVLKEQILKHSWQCSQDSREEKDKINQSIFYLFEQLKDEPEWRNKKFTQGELFCWTQDKIERLKNENKKQIVYLCCSLSPEGFQAKNLVFGKPYKYFYKITLKENSYGILLGQFSQHPDEQECLIKLNDIQTYSRIN